MKKLLILTLLTLLSCVGCKSEKSIPAEMDKLGRATGPSDGTQQPNMPHTIPPTPWLKDAVAVMLQPAWSGIPGWSTKWAFRHS